jgi:hypothetical protein
MLGDNRLLLLLATLAWLCSFCEQTECHMHNDPGLLCRTCGNYHREAGKSFRHNIKHKRVWPPILIECQKSMSESNTKHKCTQPDPDIIFSTCWLVQWRYQNSCDVTSLWIPTILNFIVVSMQQSISNNLNLNVKVFMFICVFGLNSGYADWYCTSNADLMSEHKNSGKWVNGLKSIVYR